MNFETISVFGLGYIGLPMAAMFASRKKKVIGVDVNQHVVETINRGKIHFFEPELDIMINAAVKEGYLIATLTPEPADAFLIAVPTPFKVSNSEIPAPDLKYIKEASRLIAPVLKKGDLVILESTSPVSTTEQIATWLADARTDLTFPQTHGDNADINIAFCPERVLPGNILRELIENDRVIGGMSSTCSEKAVALYSTFAKGECFITNTRTAEMVKLAENSCRDVQIAFANELSIICAKLDINVWELISLANHHPRINILQPGPGVGGHCIAVDPWFIVSKTPAEAKLIHTARKVNDAKPEWVIDKVKIAISDFLQENPSKTAKNVTIACYGLAYKPDIGDLRQSPALEIINKLSVLHVGKVLAIDPNLDKFPHEKIKFVSINEGLKADIHLVLVNHKEFEELNFDSGIIINCVRN